MANAPYDLCACPSCGTEFRVTAADLAVDDGQVRCGACLKVFDGRARREAPPVLAAAATSAPRPAASTSAAGARDSSSASVGARLGTPASRQHAGGTPAPPASVTRAPAPDAAAAGIRSRASPRSRRPAAPRTRPRIGWRLAGVLAFGAALGANAMALRHYGGQPDLGAFEVAAPLAVERMESPSGFAVSGRLANRADIPQRLPSLLVRLQHEDATVAEARFRPGEYLAGRRTRTPINRLLGETLAANESTFVALRVEDAEGAATTATVTLAWP